MRDRRVRLLQRAAGGVRRLLTCRRSTTQVGFGSCSATGHDTNHALSEGSERVSQRVLGRDAAHLTGRAVAIELGGDERVNERVQRWLSRTRHIDKPAVPAVCGEMTI